MVIRQEIAGTDDTQVIKISDDTEVIAAVPANDQEPSTRRRRVRRIVLITLLVLALLGGGTLLAGGLYLRSIEGDIGRVDAFDEVPEVERPVKAATATAAKDILIL